MVWMGVFQIVLCIAVVFKLNINQQLRFICKLPTQYLFYILSPVTSNPDVPIFIKKTSRNISETSALAAIWNSPTLEASCNVDKNATRKQVKQEIIIPDFLQHHKFYISV